MTTAKRRRRTPTSTVHLSPTRFHAFLAALPLVLSLCISSAGFAEVLTLHDGQIIETKGPWKIEGRRITYTALNGTYSALRTSLVDLEKSRELFQQRLNPAAPAPTPERRDSPSVGLVVRQTDVARNVDKDQPKDQETGPAVPAGSIGVSNWDEVLVAQGTKLSGTLRNATVATYLRLELNVTLVGDNGDALATQPAELEKNWLGPNSEMPFEITFPDVFAYSDTTFKVNGTPLRRPAKDEEDSDTGQGTTGTPDSASSDPPSQRPPTQRPPTQRLPTQ